MAPMALSYRLLAALVICVLAGDHAAAQFRRGILAESAEISLFPAIAPALLLPAGSFAVDVKNQSTGPTRLLSKLDESITRGLEENDNRLEAATAKPDMTVVATLTEWTMNRRRGTRYVSERRQIGTKQVKDSKGNYKTEPIYEYGRNKPTVIDDGAATIRLEVRRGSQVLADETARVTYHDDRLAEEGSRATSEVEDELLDRAATRAAGLVTPAREPVKVLLARSDEVDRLNDLARSRKWNEWRAALQETRPHRDPKRDAYRLHNIGVAHEALAYEATNDEDTQRLLTQAATFVQQAVTAKKDEKYFTEAFGRISANSLSYTRLRAMHASLGLRQTTAPPAAATTAKAPAAETVKLAAKSPTKESPSAAAPMTNADVIDLRKAGLDDDNLIAAIKDAGATRFDLTPAGLKTLLSAKVTNRVITAMRERK
jgi:hypothetical protein